MEIVVPGVNNFLTGIFVWIYVIVFISYLISIIQILVPGVQYALVIVASNLFLYFGGRRNIRWIHQIFKW